MVGIETRFTLCFKFYYHVCRQGESIQVKYPNVWRTIHTNITICGSM